jgi:hypothetical protein
MAKCSRHPRLDAEGADPCCFGIEQSIFAAPHTSKIRLLSCSCAFSDGMF